MNFLKTLKNNAFLLSVDLLGTLVAKTRKYLKSYFIRTKIPFNVFFYFPVFLFLSPDAILKQLKETSNICLLIRCLKRCIKMAGDFGLLDVDQCGHPSDQDTLQFD